MFTDTALNGALNAVALADVGLHSAWPGRDGSLAELTGGSPAYARKAITIGTASGKQRAATTQPVFDIPASTTVAWITGWTAATGGSCLGISPMNGIPREFVADPSTDTIRAQAHGLANGDKVVFFGDTPPGGLGEGTIYYVVSTATDMFQVSLTQGGAAIDLTSTGGADCWVSKIVPEVYANQGQLTLSAATLAMS